MKLSLSCSYSRLTPGQPVPALALERQTPVRVDTGVPILKSLVRLDLEEDPRQKRESNPGLPLWRQTPYHEADEAVWWGRKTSRGEVAADPPARSVQHADNRQG